MLLSPSHVMVLSPSTIKAVLRGAGFSYVGGGEGVGRVRGEEGEGDVSI